MVDITDPAEFERLMVRVQARRVAQAYQGAGKVVPLGAAAIFVGDTEEARGPWRRVREGAGDL